MFFFGGGAVFLIIQRGQVLGVFSPRKSYVLVFYKNGFGYILGDFYDGINKVRLIRYD
jgi:hypothetical protein